MSRTSQAAARSEHDVVVIGAGPSGATTALLLARAGHRVLLLDRHRFPRAKPCGDCLSPQANRVLHRLRLLDAVLAERPARLAGWRVIAGNAGFQASFASCTPDPLLAHGLALPRERLDAVLLNAAADAGVHVRTGARATDLLRDAAGAVRGVRISADGAPEDVRAKLVIGADGLRSLAARRMGWIARPPRVRKLSLTMHVPLRARALGEMHLSERGCLGIAPVVQDGGTCNVTLVVSTPRFGTRAREAHAFFRASLEHFPHAPPELQPALEAQPHILASGPFDWRMREIAADGVALVGDAAGYFDPFTGQGIHQALAGAELLAHHAARHLSGETGALRNYAAAHRVLTAPSRRLQRIIEVVLERPHLARAFIQRLDSAGTAAAALIAVTGDLRPARTLLSPSVLLSFLGVRELPLPAY